MGECCYGYPANAIDSLSSATVPLHVVLSLTHLWQHCDQAADVRVSRQYGVKKKTCEHSILDRKNTLDIHLFSMFIAPQRDEVAKRGPSIGRKLTKRRSSIMESTIWQWEWEELGYPLIASVAFGQGKF